MSEIGLSFLSFLRIDLITIFINIYITMQEKGSYNLESLVDKDDLSSLKNVDPSKSD